MSIKPYTGPAYSPDMVRLLFIEETPEKFTMHSAAGRRTIADDTDDERGAARSATLITPITQPEWSTPFWRLMGDDREMARGTNWWYYPVRRALVKLAEEPPDWGLRRRERRRVVVRAMRMYLFSNYDVTQIANAIGLKRHEAYRALEDASFAMTRWIGVFGREFKAYDPTAFADGLRTGGHRI